MAMEEEEMGLKEKDGKVVGRKTNSGKGLGMKTKRHKPNLYSLTYSPY